MTAQLPIIPFTRKNKLEKLRDLRRRRKLAWVPDQNQPDNEPAYKPLEWPVVRRVLGWMAPFRKLYTAALILGLVTTLLDLIGPKYIQHLADHDLPTGSLYGPHFLGRGLIAMCRWFSVSAAQNMQHAFSGPHQPYWNVAFTIFLWASTAAGAISLRRMNIGVVNFAGHQVLVGIRRRVFEHLQLLSMSFYDKTKLGRIITRGTSDVDAISNPIVNGINTLAINLLQMILAATILLFTDWRLALSVLWLGPVLYYVNMIYKKKNGEGWRIVREGFTRVSTNLAENINGMRVVTAYNRQSENLSAFNELQVYNTANNLVVAKINGFFLPLLGVIGFLGKVIILILGCYMVFSSVGLPKEKQFTVGTLIAAWIYWDVFMGPVQNFGNFYNELMMAMASAERIQSLLDQKPDVMDQPQSPPLPPVEGRVNFDDVVFAYDPAKPVLHGITFEAQAGQTIALVGHTGCGKSTIISLICRFYEPQSGSVRIDGYDLRTVTGESLHKQMGIVSQANFLFSGTVLENIKYAKPDASDEDVYASAQALGSHEIILALKDGYSTQVGERGASMSLGQRQLICFTRAFLANPRILMLDEATSAVDTHTEMLIQQALEKLVAHRTTFIVAHRLSTVVNADLVLVLDHGHIVERGNHAALLAKGGKYAELYKQFTREV